ncbi:MAG TPA: ribonuclease HI family protein [Pyrinomonadaceae bacterium]|jgi:ribonuclease HI
MNRRELLENTKLSKLPKLPVRRSFDNVLKLRNDNYGLENPDIIVSSKAIVYDAKVESKVGKIITIECDSICQPNPGGIGCIAWVAYDEKRQIIGQHFESIGNGESITNNVAEYSSVISALKWCLRKFEEIKVLTSSQLVVEQISGKWECKSELLKPLLGNASAYVALTAATINWIPQKENKVANALCELAYLKARRELGGVKNEN